MTTSDLMTKDPDAKLKYGWDWKASTNGTDGGTSDWLASGETISSYTITADDGITVVSDSESGGKVLVELSGGTAGQVYDVACKITTSANNVDERTIHINVRNR